eukprot:SAG22_NODE_741_length_7507_cov_2.893224_3_plen_265_part_00
MGHHSLINQGVLNLTAIRADDANRSVVGYQLKTVYSGLGSTGVPWKSKVASLATVSPNFTHIVWYDHSVWARQVGAGAGGGATEDSGGGDTLYSRCCKACTEHVGPKTCKAWTADPIRGTCALVSSTGTAYPSAYAVSGYPVRSDPAAYCKAEILGNRFPMQDPTMAHDVSCGSIAPAGSGGGGGGGGAGKFPRAWRDANRKHRGTAWLFFPSRPTAGAAGSPQEPVLDGLWTPGGADKQLALLISCLGGCVWTSVMSVVWPCL